MYLSCHSHFSLLYGTLAPKDLFLEAQKNQVKKLVLTDINNTSAFIEMIRICKENEDEFGLEVIPGIESREDGKFLYTAIAMNNDGFEEINHFLSKHNLDRTNLPASPPPFRMPIRFLRLTIPCHSISENGNI